MDKKNRVHSSNAKRTPKRAGNCKLMCCNINPERVVEIRTDAAAEPGHWAQSVNYGPACHCGLRSTTEPCGRHK